MSKKDDEASAAKHPATKLPLAERVDYLVVVAAMAAADGEIADEEISALRKSCTDLGLGAKQMAEVIGATEDPDSVRLRAVATRLRSSELRFTLMTDLVSMAHADGPFVDAERRELDALADQLNITPTQLAAIEKYVEALRKASAAEGVDSADLKKLGGDVAAGLAAAGVPIAAVAVSGTVFGLSAAGITSGLAALGLGLGMASGLAVAVGIGVGTYLGVRWFYKRLVEE